MRGPPDTRRLLTELRRRHVLRVAAFYIAGSWLVLQVIDVVGPGFNWPPNAVAIALPFLASGLPIALIAAWVLGGSSFVQSAAPAVTVNAAPTPSSGTRRRLIVLPFRVLRPDPDTDFLAFSLADAITTSLSTFQSLVLRSTAAAGKLDVEDLDEVGRKAGVDLVLTGTLLRVGDQLRVSTQLVELPDKDLIASITKQLPLDDLFAAQETITRSVIESLELPLTRADWQRFERDVPQSTSAYELYLRANEASVHVNQWEPAIEMYLRCVREDPTFAPAWARLGRCYRLIAKYTAPTDQIAPTLQLAEEAFKRALTLNPELSLAHSLYAQLDIDRGRARDAMTRLLARVATAGGDPDLYAGLVQACRFAGLLQASLAAHQKARAIDPVALTSVSHTYFMLGDYDGALAEYRETDIGYTRGLALAHLGRTREAIVALSERERVASGRVKPYIMSLGALLIGDEATALQQSLEAIGVESKEAFVTTSIDPEAAYYIVCHLAKLGETEIAIKLLWYVVRNGYNCALMLQRDPWLEALRGSAEFERIQQFCDDELRAAKEAFDAADGPRLLGSGATPPRPTILAQ